MKKDVFVFDLDGTTIDSFHRVKPCLLANGDLDLQKYIDEACTPEKIANDTLLPLASYMKALIASGKTVVTMTARYCNNADYVYLRKHGLKTAIHLSRDQLGRVFGKEQGDAISKLGDAEYKRQWFYHLFETMGNDTQYHFFDDHEGILEMANGLPNVTATDAVLLNQLAKMQFADAYQQGCDDSESLYEDLITECSRDDIIINPAIVVQ